MARMVIRVEPTQFAKAIEQVMYTLGDLSLEIIDELAKPAGVVFCRAVVTETVRVRQGSLNVSVQDQVWCAIGNQCGEILTASLN